MATRIISAQPDLGYFGITPGLYYFSITQIVLRLVSHCSAPSRTAATLRKLAELAATWAVKPNCDVHCRDRLWPLHVDSGRPLRNGNGAKDVEAILFAYLSARLRRLRRVVGSRPTCELSSLGVLSISVSKEGL